MSRKSIPGIEPEPGSTAAVGRRDFLRLAGFSVGSAFLNGCREAPVGRIVPGLVPSEETVPGVPAKYATVCQACPAGCGVLATCLDGRPIKLEGNPDHPVSGGALCAVGQASILELYDAKRPRKPQIDGVSVSWPQLDRELMGQLGLPGDGDCYFVTGTGLGPAAEWTIRRFLAHLGGGQHVAYDPFGGSVILEAHHKTHGLRVLPRFDLARADAVVGIEADFLGSWISPVEHSQGYRAARTLEGSRLKFSTHWQFECGWSLTGSRADRRFAIHPSRISSLLLSLAREVAERSGLGLDTPRVSSPIPEELLEEMVDLLWQNRGRSLLLCGFQDLDCQIVTNLVNHLLQNYGKTADLAYPSFQKQGDEGRILELLEALRLKRVRAVFLAGVNPVYDLPFGEELGRLLAQVPISVAFAQQLDETVRLAKYLCPTPHYLEAWTDARPTARVRSLCQPVFPRIGETRALVENLSEWMGHPQSDLEIVRAHWEKEVFPQRTGFESFDLFWNQTLHDGQAAIRPERHEPLPFNLDVASEAARRQATGAARMQEVDSLAMVPSRTIRDSSHGHNPWLQELPDPFTRQAWGNCFEIGSDLAGRLEVTQGDLLEISLERVSGTAPALTLPVAVLPGMADRVVSVSMGHGGLLSERLSGLGPKWVGADPPNPLEPIGGRVSQFLRVAGGRLEFTASRIRLRKVEKRADLALVQVDPEDAELPKWLENDPGTEGPVREVNLTTLISTPPLLQEEEKVSVWDADHRYTGKRWGMAVDLGACTGCSACVIACQAENNIPVVGRDEVKRRRAMHWIRVDRYFGGSEKDRRVRFQPVACQQCDQAPCEAVCPVFATVHSREGLNEQIYNRCIGTRYCANNCPYKVRVFNWFDYSREQPFESLQLNPEVTVRSRGVMEKCTFCVQRIRSARYRAVIEGRELEDGEAQSACEQTCPSRAIAFGDLNDPESKVSKLARGTRSYRLLEALGTQPSVYYLAAVCNRPEEAEDG